jgi:Fe-S-cluster containining protein
MIKKKVTISESLQGLLKQMNPQQEQMVVQMFQHYMEQFAELRVANNAESVSDAVHKQVDEMMAEVIAEANKTKEKVSCGKGCSFCCFQQVDISDDEATLITEYTREIGKEIDYDMLQKQFATKDYGTLPLKERKCIFLDDMDSCSIYEHRPSACRKLVVVNDPALCDTEKNKGAEVKRLVSLEAEVVTSASLNFRESGSMAKMLIEAKKD